MLLWICAVNAGQKVGVYCSDVAGAFDRVSAYRLLEKLALKEIPSCILRVLDSWLLPRSAQVIVDGRQSESLVLKDMVYQGTVLGPPLCNCFYEDARVAVSSLGFQEVVYADDFNCFEAFPRSTANSIIMDALAEWQHELHSWGRAKHVIFDPEGIRKYYQYDGACWCCGQDPWYRGGHEVTHGIRCMCSRCGLAHQIYIVQ